MQYLSQSVATTVGLQYYLKIWVAVFYCDAGGPNNGFKAFVGGTQVISFTNAAETSTYTYYYYAFTATTTSTIIKLGGADPPGMIGVDDVVVRYQ